MILCGRINRIHETSATHKIRKSCATHRQHLVLCWVSLTIQWFDTVYFMVTQMIRITNIIIKNATFDHKFQKILRRPKAAAPQAKTSWRPPKRLLCESKMPNIHWKIMPVTSYHASFIYQPWISSLALPLRHARKKLCLGGSWFNFSFASEATYVPQFPQVCFNVHLDPRVV